MRFKIIASFIICGLLTGCAHIYGKHGLIKKQNNNQYLNSHCDPILQLPQDLDSQAMQDSYPIPKIVATAEIKPVSITPPGSESTKRLTEDKAKKRSIFTKIRDWW
jgi:uncharacterized lipoprotein